METKIENKSKLDGKEKFKQALVIFLTFFKLGLFTFGGGYAMISLLHETIVEKKGWLNDDEMLEIIGVAESTPGPIAINMATFVGYKRLGVLGAIFATLGVVLPSMVIIFSISLFFEAFLENQYVKYAFYGIKAGVSLLILNAGIDMIKKIPHKLIPYLVFILVVIFMLVIELFSLSFSSIFLILIGGFIGIITSGIIKTKKENKK